ncbi:exodeoxyribonuclease VIII [Pseudoalteromonas phage PHS21]|nr:exodeoxyribonuclease VIII [Pseudoalteromonas phage PHS21]
MDNFTDVMIDIETLSTEQDAAIISIAAVYFNPETGAIGDDFYTNVNLQSNINAGRNISASTLLWWMQQEKSAQEQVFSLNHTAPKLSDSLKLFIEFFKNDSLKVWGNGATFDMTILESAFKRCKLTTPWKFWNIRDVRTAVEMGQLLDFNPKKDMPFTGIRHNALDDSKHQAKYVSAIYQRINKVINKVNQ